jgi:hypothetical protein
VSSDFEKKFLESENFLLSWGHHMNKSTELLIDTPNSWQQEWVGMPEFEQVKVEPYSKIIVRFDSEEDLQEFAAMIGQKLTSKTKSIWHPKLVAGEQSGTHLVYVDES